MLDVSHTNPMCACATFAIEWLRLIASHEFTQAESLLDVNETGKPLKEVFPLSSEFTYSHPEQFQDWNIHFLCADDTGFFFAFDVPFVEERYRAMEARFGADRSGTMLRIRFEALVPS